MSLHSATVTSAPRRAVSLSTELHYWKSSPAAIRTAQRFRYTIFGQEMGARLHSPISGLDHDRFDEFCAHLLVRDLQTGNVVGYTRILDRAAAARAGSFYSETEFEIDRILALPGDIAEIGRTCIHPAYRNGSTISVLWSGLAEFITQHRSKYLIGCASLPLPQAFGYAAIHHTAQNLLDRFGAAPELRVNPLLPLPEASLPVDMPKVSLPPLLKAYLRVGAKICGPPCLDADFQVADFFIMVDTKGLDRRYARHFLS